MEGLRHDDDSWGWEEPEEYQEIFIPENPSPEHVESALKPFAMGAAAVGIVITGSMAAWQVRKRHKGKSNVSTN